MPRQPDRPKYTVPGLTLAHGGDVAAVLQERLVALLDLALTLKHVHWNVVGPRFIAVHKMLDPQVASVHRMIDKTAERVATLGAAPRGTPGAVVEARSWPDYPLGRATTVDHLRALDAVYDRVASSHRDAADRLHGLDDVSQRILLHQLRRLEFFQWLVRAHLESAGGSLGATR
ncbi:DNA starvation/stationary phase protection protein [Cellulomonas cellasea]|uniref:Dps family protein n=1 Tax=Cellulomonas cellasea TaxID=43670 RepID=UPI0025A4675E|nr:DNA starvation/stationary phase protection protein [Cellulomonas cellasea]MDM8084320.1 DNA starvation/stationary phase protection protein [Cellulomonas cellasea]